MCFLFSLPKENAIRYIHHTTFSLSFVCLFVIFFWMYSLHLPIKNGFRYIHVYVYTYMKDVDNNFINRSNEQQRKCLQGLMYSIHNTYIHNTFTRENIIIIYACLQYIVEEVKKKRDMMRHSHSSTHIGIFNSFFDYKYTIMKSMKKCRHKRILFLSLKNMKI